MGAIKHQQKVLDFFRKTPVASILSVRKIVGEKSTYVYLLLNKMVAQGKLHRLTRGMYSLTDDPTLAVFCFKPAYLGLQEALGIHNLWEQETNAVILTTKTVREGPRLVSGSTVLLKRIPPQLFFGIEYQQYWDFYLPVSDVEKTFLDLIYFRQHIDKELLHQFRRRINRKTLKKYLAYYDPALRKEVQRFIKL